MLSKKSTSAAIALRGIAQSNWGAKDKEVCQLFQAAIRTRMDFAI